MGDHFKGVTDAENLVAIFENEYKISLSYWIYRFSLHLFLIEVNIKNLIRPINGRLLIKRKLKILKVNILKILVR